MTKSEFLEQYCKLCGTQRCYSIYDKLFAEGCRLAQEIQPTEDEEENDRTMDKMG